MGIIETMQRVNNRVCPWWLCHTFDNPLRRFFHKPEILLAPYLGPGMSAADIGCGMGYFTLGMAKRIGPAGRVIAVDLQQKMLDALSKRAHREGLADWILLHRCRQESLGIKEAVDFALVFWMAHEVPDKPRFFREILALLNPAGRLLLVEPKFHVTKRSFAETVAVCREVGFRDLGGPEIALSRAVLFTISSRRSPQKGC